MPKTSDIQLGTKPIMCLFKGNVKTRKTTAAASFPGPMYIADFDNRIDPVKKEFPNRTDIEYDTYNSSNFSAFMQKKNSLINDLKNSRNNPPYNTIVMPDSLTYFTEAVMNYTIDSRGGSAKSKNKGEISLLQIDDYSAETRVISELIDDLKIIHSYDVNVIVTAHVMEQETRDLSGKIIDTQQYLICYGRKVATKIPGAFNEVYHFFVEEQLDPTIGAQYKIKTQSTGKDFAGTALPNLPSEINWTNKNFYETLMGYVKK